VNTTSLLNLVSGKSLKKEIAHFESGDTVDVHCKIKEGDKERVQVFSGVVIARKGSGMGEMITVRRVVDNEGVERIFPLNSPFIDKIVPVRSGRVRRSKLYYLRERTGKSTKLAHRFSEHTAVK
jgi:large subunit ribosomal protein L19